MEDSAATEVGEVMEASIHTMVTVTITIIRAIAISDTDTIAARMHTVSFRREKVVFQPKAAIVAIIKITCNNKRKSNKFIVKRA